MHRAMDRVSERSSSVCAVRFERLRMETLRKEPDKVNLRWAGPVPDAKTGRTPRNCPEYRTRLFLQ